MAAIDLLPHLNAALNATAAVLLVRGRRLVRRGERDAHRRTMLAAVAVSAVFLVSYLTYHVVRGATRFPGQGWIRPLYFAILGSHTVLAAAVPVLAGVALVLAWKGDFRRHRAVARVAWPVWLYVSATGVAVYALLYHLYPAR